MNKNKIKITGVVIFCFIAFILSCGFSYASSQKEEQKIGQRDYKLLAQEDAKTKEEIASLMQGLNDKDAGVRASAASALGEIGPAAKEAVPALIKMLSDEDKNVRRSAVSALDRMGFSAKEVTALLIPLHIKALNDKDAWVRVQAASALGNIGPAAKDAVPALTKLLNDENEDVRKAAQEAIEKIGK